MTLSEGMWKALDLIVKGIFGTIITVMITLYGMKAEESRQEIAEANKQLNALIEFTSKQKDLDVNLGMRMFETLMTRYFRKDESIGSAERVREKMLLLRLIALNFQDVPINLKPLFQELDSHLTDSKREEELRGIAKEVARRQAYRLTFVNGFDSGPRLVKAYDEITPTDRPFRIKIESVEKDHVKASLILFDNRTIGPFSITYFDMPLIDNVKLGEERVSLLLISSNGQQAEVRLVAFESDLAADRFDIKEMTRPLRQKDLK